LILRLFNDDNSTPQVESDEKKTMNGEMVLSEGVAAFPSKTEEIDKKKL
jgi:hypothetical protein